MTYFSYGLWTYLALTCEAFVIWLTPVLCKKFLGDLVLVGYLGLGFHICLQTTAVVPSIGEGIFPSLVEFYVTKDERLSSALEMTWKYSNLILFPAIAFLVVLVKPVISLLIGDEFLPAAKIVYLLLPGICLSRLSTVPRHILQVHKRYGYLFFGYFSGLLCFAASALYLIIGYGITGAASSVSLGLIVTFAILSVLSYRLEKINHYFIHFFKPLMAAFTMTIILNFIPVSSVASLMISFVIGGISYLGFLFLTRGIDKTDIDRVREALVLSKGE
jgi:O-antigen/teichoic acid export membrane protein